MVNINANSSHDSSPSTPGTSESLVPEEQPQDDAVKGSDSPAIPSSATLPPESAPSSTSPIAIAGLDATVIAEVIAIAHALNLDCDEQFYEVNGAAGIELVRNFSRYQTAIEEIENTRKRSSSLATKPSAEQALEVLLARDQLQDSIDECDQSSALTVKLLELDTRLRALGPDLAKSGSLTEWKSSINPPDSAWWWQFEPPVQIGAWDKLDWLWNGLTAAALAATASFSVSILQAMSVGGLTWQASLGTIAQGAGLALLGGGALTTDGQKKVQGLLRNYNIPPEFYSEITFAASLSLFFMVSGLYSFLPGYFYRQGAKAYEVGDLNAAQEKLQEALSLDPGQTDAHLVLGTVYETLGELDLALESYEHVVQAGGPRGFNNAGRIYIQRLDPNTQTPDLQMAETYLRMGLQRAYSYTDAQLNNPSMAEANQVALRATLQEARYQLHRNLGWALLSQDRYAEAEEELNQAIQLDESISERQQGTGFAYCLMAVTQEGLGQTNLATQFWHDCQTKARPETLDEYRWLMQAGAHRLAGCVDTSGVVQGLEQLPWEFDEVCLAGVQSIPPQLPSKENVGVYVERFQKTLEETWSPDPSVVTEPLRYYVSLTSNGSLYNYAPLHKLAADLQAQAPLADLYANSKIIDRSTVMVPKAEFELVLNPDGGIAFLPWTRLDPPHLIPQADTEKPPAEPKPPAGNP